MQDYHVLQEFDRKSCAVLGNSHASSSEIDNTNAGKLKGGFKAEKEAQKRGDAGNRATWNTLFMRADTVVEAVAEHYGVKKSELMDRDASDLGVRMALGETQVIAKTKEALGEAGELSTLIILVFKAQSMMLL